MRKAFILGVCSLALAAPAASAQGAAGAKIGYINMQALFQVAPGRVEAAAVLDKEKTKLNDEYKAMQDSMTKLVDAFDKEQATMTPAAKTERTKMLAAKQAGFEERVQKMQASTQEREADLLEPIQELMQKVLEDFRTENGYTVIFDVAQAGIVAIDKNLDVTDKVSTRLAKMPAPKTIAAPAKTPVGPVANPAGAGAKKPPPQ